MASSGVWGGSVTQREDFCTLSETRRSSQEAGKLQIGTLRADDSHRVKRLDLCPLKCSLQSSPVESQ